MSYVDRYLIPLVLAPGVVIHEFAHYLVCTVLNVQVGEVVFFRFGNPAGYVEHQIPQSYTKRILISTAPLVVNTTVAIGAFWWSTQAVVVYSTLAIYVGVVVIAASLPSTVDATNLFPNTRMGYLHPLFYLTLPLIVLLLAVNRLRRYGFNVLYTVATSALLLVIFHTDVIQIADVVRLVVSRLQ